MKLFCFLIGIFTYGFTCAQQPPALPPGPSGETLPGISILRPEYAPPPASLPTGASTATDNPMARQELADLIRAQTEAIRALSSKVDSLDDRLRRIESKLR